VDIGGQEGNQSEQYMYFKKRVASCFYWERKLQGFREAMKENDVMAPGMEVSPAEVKGDVLSGVKTWAETAEKELEQHLEYKKQFETLINEQRERKHVLESCRDALPFHREEYEQKQPVGSSRLDEQKESGGDVELKGRPRKGSREELKKPLIKEDAEDNQKVSSLNGVIAVAKRGMFERMLFRVTRGNVVPMFHEIEEDIVDPASGEETKKCVFSIDFFWKQITSACK